LALLFIDSVSDSFALPLLASSADFLKLDGALPITDSVALLLVADATHLFIDSAALLFIAVGALLLINCVSYCGTLLFIDS